MPLQVDVQFSVVSGGHWHLLSFVSLQVDAQSSVGSGGHYDPAKDVVLRLEFLTARQARVGPPNLPQCVAVADLSYTCYAMLLQSAMYMFTWPIAAAWHSNRPFTCCRLPSGLKAAHSQLHSCVCEVCAKSTPPIQSGMQAAEHFFALSCMHTSVSMSQQSNLPVGCACTVCDSVLVVDTDGGDGVPLVGVWAEANRCESGLLT